MDKIFIRLFNTPMILKNNETILLPYKKAEALLYYLLVEKQATRDELVNLLWGELNEQKARKNLRNTMYKIRKAFEMDIIISPQKSIVEINPDLVIETDLDEFVVNEEVKIQVYTGEFLKGFLLKDAEKFEEWMFHKKQYYADLYTKYLYNAINEAYDENDIHSIEQYVDLLIRLDELEEKPYRILMKLYMEQGSYHRAIETYYKLSEVLDKELGVEPSEKTRGLYGEIVMARNQKRIKNNLNKSFFYGRDQELQLLRNNYTRFLNNESVESIMITGEAGIGKTKLIEQFLGDIDQEEIYIMSTNCYQAEKEYILKPWNPIFSKIAKIISKEKLKTPALWENVIAFLFPVFETENTINLNSANPLKYQVAEEVIADMLRKISEKKKILFIFEDLHWMDITSLSLLNSILVHMRNNKIFFIGTCRDVRNEELENYVSQWIRYDLVEKIHIPRFIRKEVESFILKALPNYEEYHISLDKIYAETEGNTFFLVEFLNCIKNRGICDFSLDMSPKIEDILKSRFVDISSDSRMVLNICSLFFDKVRLGMLIPLIDKDEMQIIEIIEELQQKNILKETKDIHEITFEFTHQKLREFIYYQQSSTRRKIFHNKIGALLEKNLKNDKSDIFMYSNLIYHYKNAGNLLSALNYMIKNAKLYFDFEHEFFPTLYYDDSKKNEKYLHIAKDDSIKYLKDIEDIIGDIKKTNYNVDEIKSLEIDYLHMKGRYLIRAGKYKEGMNYIKDMVDKALAIASYDNALKGYKQIIYYYRQVHNVELMSYYIQQGLHMATNHNQQEQIGILLRLKGLNKIMKGQYEEAEEILHVSIEIFNNIEHSDDRYVLNIAAAYNYIGEIRYQTGRFSEALDYYKKAIQICQERHVSQGLYMFLIGAGKATFEMNDYKNATSYFEEAMGIYDQIDVIWGRAMAEGYMAWLLVKQGNYVKALNYISRAKKYARITKSPYELGVVYKIKAIIKQDMKYNKSLKKVFSKCLTLSFEQYYKKAMRYFEKTNYSHEIETLKYLSKSN